MVSLLLLVFLLQLGVHVVNLVGPTTLNELLWQLYSTLPTASSKDAQEQIKLQRDVMRLKRELGNISAQDDFAKWAKLRRQHDKVLAEYEKSASSSQTTRNTFNQGVNTVRWISLNGLRMFIQFWYAKRPIFWIPQGWLPYYVEWILSFPKAPVGSISINVWSIACASVVSMVAEALLAVSALALKPPEKKKAQAMKVGMEKGDTASSTGNTEKREL